MKQKTLRIQVLLSFDAEISHDDRTIDLSDYADSAIESFESGIREQFGSEFKFEINHVEFTEVE